MAATALPAPLALVLVAAATVRGEGLARRDVAALVDERGGVGAGSQLRGGGGHGTSVSRGRAQDIGRTPRSPAGHYGERVTR